MLGSDSTEPAWQATRSTSSLGGIRGPPPGPRNFLGISWDDAVMFGRCSIKVDERYREVLGLPFVFRHWLSLLLSLFTGEWPEVATVILGFPEQIPMALFLCLSWRVCSLKASGWC